MSDDQAAFTVPDSFNLTKPVQQVQLMANQIRHPYWYNGNYFLWFVAFSRLQACFCARNVPYSVAWPVSAVLPSRTPFKYFHAFTVNLQNCLLFHSCSFASRTRVCAVPFRLSLDSLHVCRFCYIHAQGCFCMCALPHKHCVCAVLFPPLTLVARFVTFSIVFVRVLTS